jgi:transposase InsO family protein
VDEFRAPLLVAAVSRSTQSICGLRCSGSDRSAVHAIACRSLALRHLRARPYLPQTNGKAERFILFIRTLLSGCADGAIYASSAEHTAALARWIDFSDRRGPHSAVTRKPPIARLNELNNLLGSHN